MFATRVPRLSTHVRMLYAISSLFYLMLSAALATVASTRCLLPMHALGARLLALCLALQAALSYLGDVQEFLSTGHGPWGLVDRGAAVVSTALCVGLTIPVWLSGAMPTLHVVVSGLLLAVSLVCLLAGVVLVRRTGVWSAEERPALWAGCHVLWHTLSTASGLVLLLGVTAPRDAACAVSSSSLDVLATYAVATVVVAVACFVAHREHALAVEAAAVGATAPAPSLEDAATRLTARTAHSAGRDASRPQDDSLLLPSDSGASS